jgi:hypothetical protein
MKYINRAVDLVMKSAAQYTGQDYVNMNGDIGIGDAAHAYAVGYDWLYPFLTEEQKTVLLAKLEELGAIIHSLSELTLERPGVTSNHNSVTAGGLGLAALVLGDKPEWFAHALRQIIEYYRTSTDDDGFNGEGIGYYCYGALGGHTFSAAYLRVNPKEDLLDQYAKSREFLENMVVQYLKPNGGGYIPIGDSDSTIGSPGITYIIAKYQSGAGLWAYLELTGENGDKSYGLSDSGSGASMPYTLIWADPSLTPVSPAEHGSPTTTDFDWGYSIFRDGFDPLDTVVTFISGYLPHRGHNQRDENTFTFYSKGEEFAIDPGYTPKDSVSHNSIMVDGVGQAVPGGQYDVYGQTVYRREFGDVSYVVGEAKDAYPGRLGVKSIQRQILFSRAAENRSPYLVVIDDIIKDNDNLSTYTWLLQTPKRNHYALGEGVATVIGANFGNVMRVEFPFQRDVFLRVDSFGRKILTGSLNVTYMNANTLKTLEAVFTGRTATRLVSVLAAEEYAKELPVITASGTSTDGTLTLKFRDGTEDTVVLTDKFSRFQRRQDAEPTVPPPAPPPPSVAQLLEKTDRPVTVNIDGVPQDFETSPYFKDGEVYAATEELIGKFADLLDGQPELAEQIRRLSSEGFVSLKDVCEIAGGSMLWDETMLDAEIQTKFDTETVLPPNTGYDRMTGAKQNIISIDARLDQAENPPEHAIDGDENTIYAVDGDGGVPVILELEHSAQITGAAVALSRGNQRMGRFHILISEDKENWITVYQAESGGGTEGFEGYTFRGVSGKYVQILGFGNTANSWNSFREIEIFGK